MSNFPKAGEWWFSEARDSRVFIVGKDSDGLLWVQEYAVGDCKKRPCFNHWGNWHHEPACTGWDWQPEKTICYKHTTPGIILKRVGGKVTYFEKGRVDISSWNSYLDKQNFEEISEVMANHAISSANFLANFWKKT